MDIMLQRILELVDSDGYGGGAKLAAAIGAPRNVVTEWRKGRKKSYRKYAAEIADYYGVSVDYLCGNTDEKGIKKSPTADDGERNEVLGEIISILASKTTEQQKAFLQILRHL